MNSDSERLHFRFFTEGDFPIYFQLTGNEQVMRYIAGKALTEPEARTRFQRLLKTNADNPGLGFSLAESREDGKLIGFVKLTWLEESLEAGYAVLPEYWRQGYASEMLHYLLKYGQIQMQVSDFVGVVMADHPASRKVLEKAGFTFKKRIEQEGGAIEHHQLQLTSV